MCQSTSRLAGADELGKLSDHGGVLCSPRAVVAALSSSAGLPGFLGAVSGFPLRSALTR